MKWLEKVSLPMSDLSPIVMAHILETYNNINNPENHKNRIW